MKRFSWTRGAQFESLAQHFLECQGYRLLKRNFLSFGGEIDLIMRNDHTLIFVEVRDRRHNDYGSALDSIDVKKQQRIERTVEHFLKRHCQYRHLAYRIDAIAIDGNSLQWYHNAF